MTEYTNIRTNTISGYYKKENASIEPDNVDIVFNEWWSGEGLDLVFQHEKPITQYSFHADELHAIASIALATGMISVEYIVETANKMKNTIT